MRLILTFVALLLVAPARANLNARHFGNIVATNRYNQTSSAQWSPLRFSAYGPAPGYQSPTLSANIGFASSFGWSGKRVDETGLIYFGARYYDPTEKRFLSYDPLGPTATPGGYAAFNGDPIYWADPDGRWAVGTYYNGVAFADALKDPERRLQALKDEQFGSASGMLNWAVENGQSINGMFKYQNPLANYFNGAALNYVSETGNNWINSAANYFHADLNSPSARFGDSLTQFGLTGVSLAFGPGEAKIATEAERLLPAIERAAAAEEGVFLFHGSRRGIVGQELSFDVSVAERSPTHMTPPTDRVIYFTDDPARAAQQYATPVGQVVRTEVPASVADAIRQTDKFGRTEYKVIDQTHLDIINQNLQIKSQRQAILDWVFGFGEP